MSLKKDLNLHCADIVMVQGYKYLIYALARNHAVVLPIDNILKGKEMKVIPKIEMDYTSLQEHVKIDQFELFCLLNQTNPLIKKTLEQFLDNEKQRNWENKKH